MEKFDIPVKIGEDIKLFSYRYSDNTNLGRTYVMNCEGKQMIVDERFALVVSDMPPQWINSIIDTLKSVMHEEES